jgi:glycosyltransferase involved in cell wall biosynthesis
MAAGQEKIRVLFLDVTPKMGGVEVTTLQEVSLLDRQRLQPILCCPEEGDLTRLCRRSGVEVHLLPLPRFPSVSLQLGQRAIANPLAILWDALLCLYATFRLARMMRRVHVQLVCTKGLFAHFYGGLAARWLGLPCIWHMQEVVEARRAGGLFRAALCLGALFLANQVIADAQTVAAQFDGLPRLHSKVLVIYNGVDTEIFKPRPPPEARERLGIPKDAFVIGCVARLMHGKGQHVLIEAFKVLADRYPDLLLVLVGKGLFDGGEYERHLRAQVSQYGLDGRVRFAGWLSGTTDVATAFNSFNVAVHVSIIPDSPLSVMEAMASGCPLVLSAVPGCNEMVREGEALFVPPGDAQGLAKAIERVYLSAEVRRCLAQRARMAATERYSLTSHVRRIEEAFVDVCSIYEVLRAENHENRGQ